jgi:predicted O-methyltransferase YrrM
MKKLIKAVLPAPILRVLVATNNNVQLCAEKSLKFDEASLRKLDAQALKAILASGEAGKAWLEDAKLIQNIYGAEDQLGGVNPGDRRALYALVLGLKPKTVLEVGTHIGASTVHLAKALSRLGEGKVITADILDVNHPEDGSWKKIGMRKPPVEYLNDLNCAQFVTFQTGPCQDFMASTQERFDLIFLDGDHRAKAVYQEVSAALPLLNEGGVILLHDYYPEGKVLYSGQEPICGPYLAMKRIMRENRRIDVLPLGALPWPTKAGGNITTLAMVVKK